MTSKAENLSVRLPQAIRAQVDELARRSRRSRSFIINEAVSTYVKAQAIYATEIEQAIKSADSGIGHSEQQVAGWLNSWASGNKQHIPEPDIYPNK